MGTSGHITSLQIFSYLAVGFLTCWGLISAILKWVEKSSYSRSGRDFHHGHTTPITRFGGLALATALAVIGVSIYFFGSLSPHNTYILGVVVLTSLAMFALGFWDDLHPLRASTKLLGQLAIASIAYDADIRIELFRIPLSGIDFHLGLLSFFLTVLWLVSLANLINLVDGLDGLAAGICFMLMFLLANSGSADPSGLSMTLAIGMAGAILGFLLFNYPPAKIYMGDGGAYFLGYLIGILSIVSSNKGSVAEALIAPAFALALPIVDVSLAILRRGLRGLPIFRADRKHIHHRLITSGASSERSVLNLYTVSLLCLFLAFSVSYSGGRMLPFSAAILLLVLLIPGHLSGFTRSWFDVSGQWSELGVLRKEAQYAIALTRWLVLEAKRCAAADKLWQDYKLVIKKLSFCHLRICLPDGSVSTWQADELDQNLTHQRRALYTLSDGTEIELHADHLVMSGRRFDLLSDLAAEAWYLVASKWSAVNGAPFHIYSRTAAADVPSRSEVGPIKSEAPGAAAESTDPLPATPAKNPAKTRLSGTQQLLR